MKVVIECVIEGIASRVDGTAVIKLSTQELDQTNAGSIFALRGKFAKCLLSDTNITALEEEMVDKTQLVSGKKQKSKAQRLRNVFFLVHSQSDNSIPFDAYYDMEMEKLIEHYKLKIKD